jgi:hypothetical protein
VAYNFTTSQLSERATLKYNSRRACPRPAASACFSRRIRSHRSLFATAAAKAAVPLSISQVFLRMDAPPPNVARDHSVYVLLSRHASVPNSKYVCCLSALYPRDGSVQYPSQQIRGYMSSMGSFGWARRRDSLPPVGRSWTTQVPSGCLVRGRRLYGEPHGLNT